MKAVTIKEAKAKLNALVDEALSGEQVVLMRGARHVAAIIPISAADLELTPRLTDEQAARLWESVVAERKAGRVASYSSTESAVAELARGARRSRRKAESGRRPDR